MIADHAPNLAERELAPRRQQVPREMTRQQAPRDVQARCNTLTHARQEVQVAAWAADRNVEHEGKRQVHE